MSGFSLKKQEILGCQKYWKKKGVLLFFPLKRESEKDLLCAAPLDYRIKELKEAFSARQEGAFVWSLRGGYGMQEILPHLKAKDFKSQKIYIGFSDGTSLHYYLNQNLNIPTVHGPHPNTFHLDLHKAKISKDYMVLLENPDKLSQVFKDLKMLNTPSKIKIRAKLIGGNLTTLVSLVGTPYDKGCRNRILFLEEVEEPAYKVNRMLNHLEQANFLRGVRAVVFGHFSHSNVKEKNKIQKVLKHWALKQKFPILSGMQAGHDHYHNHPFWLGKKSELILDENPKLLNNI